MLQNDTFDSAELHFSGVTDINISHTVAGKIFVWSAGSTPPDSPIFCIFDAIPSNSLSDILSILSNACALVLSPCALSAGILTLIVRANIPYLILCDVYDTPSLLRSQDRKIALLDTKKGVLIVNPKIETLNAHPLSYEKSLLSEESALKNGFFRSQTGVLVDTDRLREPFDTLRELSEEHCSPRIVAELSVPGSRSDEAVFCERAEAIFLAALYGDISVMLKGFCTDDDLHSARSLLHNVFCGLQEEGREFNGYIKKGLLISSPYFLMHQTRIKTPDFICLDLDPLLSRTFGAPIERIIQGADIQKAIFSIFERFCLNFSSAVVTAKTKELKNSRILSDLVSFLKIKEIYFDEPTKTS